MPRQTSDTDLCVCGHVPDEHGGDFKHPRSLACTIEDCPCIHFEAAEEDGDDE